MADTKNAGLFSVRERSRNVHVPFDCCNWYLLSVKPRQEYRAASLLENQDYTVYCPEIWVNRSKTLSANNRLEPLFPGYLFLRLSLQGANWNAIRSTRGVRDFVRFGQQTAVVHDNIIAGIKSRFESGTPDSKEVPTLNRGDKVRITGGCFEGLNAIYQYRSGKDRVIVLISLMGRLNETSVEAGVLDVARRRSRRA